MRIVHVDELSFCPRTNWCPLVKRCLNDPELRQIAEPDVDFRRSETFRTGVHSAAMRHGVHGHTRRLGDGRVAFWFEQRR